MREAAEQEAESARVRDELKSRRELSEQALAKFDEMISGARDIVARNIASLKLSENSRGGAWSFTVQHSSRKLAVELPGLDAEVVGGGNVPGDIVAFGHLEISDGSSSRSHVLGGANIVGFVREDAPWVIHFQEIQLRNMALMRPPMRGYEPFFLMQSEMREHARWLWGGAMHVYTPTHRELNVDVLVEWFAELMPQK
jgi:hypothetical protein